MEIRDMFKKAWNIFRKRDVYSYEDGGGSYYRQDYRRTCGVNDKTIVSSIYNRISMDAASINIRHVSLDENGMYLNDIDSGLNRCLSLEANIDQTSRAFVQDIVLSMFDEGVVAVVPVSTDVNPETEEYYDIYTMRVGRITQWYPSSIIVSVYNERVGRHEEVRVLKKNAAIIENPLYSIVNSPNGTMKRLVRKLALLDVVDEQSSSGKLDLIIQLPYIIKTEARKKQAEDRRKLIEEQLAGSKYGIAYTDGTEHITQLNRPVENNLMKQIEYLTNLLYSELGVTQAVLDGTADEKCMLNYYNRTIEPILSAIVDEFKRKFLTDEDRNRHESVIFMRDPFKLVPVSELASIADTFTRNEILTGNEIRQIIGKKPSSDPSANELRNKNLNDPKPFQNGKDTVINDTNKQEENDGQY